MDLNVINHGQHDGSQNLEDAHVEVRQENTETLAFLDFFRLRFHNLLAWLEIQFATGSFAGYDADGAEALVNCVRQKNDIAATFPFIRQ